MLDRIKPSTWLSRYMSCKEGSTGHKHIINTFNTQCGVKRYKMTLNDPWCAAAVSAAFAATGLKTIFPCMECSCNEMIKLAKKAGIWVEDDAYIASIGDVILYDWDDNGIGDCTGGSEHVGIIDKVDNSMYTVIEGNYKDTVGERLVHIDGRYIRGFITPKYDTKKIAKVTTDLYLRTGAGKNNRVVTIMKKDSLFTTNCVSKLIDGTLWWYGTTAINGYTYTGWASGKYLKFT